MRWLARIKLHHYIYSAILLMQLVVCDLVLMIAILSNPASIKTAIWYVEIDMSLLHSPTTYTNSSYKSG